MYKTFEEAEAAYYGLWYGAHPEREQAIEIAEYCYQTFGADVDQVIMDLIVFYGTVGRVQDARRMLHIGYDRGNWYPKEYFVAFWEQDAYREEREIWEDMRIEAIMEAGVIYKVKEPVDFDENRAYPVFVSLHGWGEDLPLFERFWESDKLNREYLHVLIQSSQMVGYSQFVWNDRELAIEEIRDVLEGVKARYKVQDPLILGGFSQGGTLAMDLAFSIEAFNARGFVSLNPHKPVLLTKDMIHNRKATLKGCILTGDQDQAFEEQKDLAKLLGEQGFEHQLVIKEDFGHWFPEDLGIRLDGAIAFIEQ